MQYLRQSTASQSVLIGPFVDSTDGVTAETGLTIANTDIRLSANGGNMASKNSGGATHDEAGWYTITLDATDTATVGRLQLSVGVAGALPVFAEFQVLEEAVFDALFAASAGAPASQASVDSLQGTADDIYTDTQSITGRLPAALVSGRIDASVGAIANNAITAAALAADAGAEIGRAVWDVDLSGDLTANLAGTVLYTNVYTPLGNLIADIGANGSGLTAIPWNAAWDAEVQSECTDALNAYDPPTNTEMAAAFTEIKGATWTTTDTLEAIRDRGDAAWTTATGFSTHSAADVRTEMDSNSTQLAAIVADTNELQGDWANGGRLDLILDASAAQFTTALSESYRAADAVGTPSQILQEILQGMSDFVISGTTKTVRRRDSATTAKTYTLNDGTTPSGMTEAT